jgi:hypothetical protein
MQMMLTLLLQLIVIGTLVKTGRRRLEDALPWFCFFLVLMPLESKVVIPGLFDVNTMRVSLLTLLYLYWRKRRRFNREPVPFKRLMFVHIAWALLSTVYSLSIATSFKQLLAQVLEFYLMYYLLIRIVSSVATIHKMLYAMMMAIAICCILGLFEPYAHWSVLRIFPAENWTTYNGGLDPLYSELGRGIRVRSTFPHPILFGDALAMSIPVALYLISIWRDGRQRLLLWMSLLLMFWAIYKTESRGPWLATGMCCFLLFFLVTKRVRRYLILLAVLTGITVLSRPGILETVDGLYQATTDPSQPVGTSYLYRHALSVSIRGAVDASPTRTLLGYGLGTFRTLGLEINFLDETRRWYTCDDNWSLFLYETGYVGLLLIGTLLFSAAIYALRTSWMFRGKTGVMSGVFFVCLAGFYFLMLSVAAYSWGQQGYMSWILISLAVSHRRVLLRERALEEHQKRSQKELNASEQHAVLALVHALG